jgi:hypothetical protein
MKWIILLTFFFLTGCNVAPFDDQRGERDSKQALESFDFIFRAKPPADVKNIQSYTHTGPMDQRYYLNFSFNNLEKIQEFLKINKFQLEDKSQNEGSRTEVAWWPEKLSSFNMWSKVNGKEQPWGVTYVWIDNENKEIYTYTQ